MTNSSSIRTRARGVVATGLVLAAIAAPSTALASRPDDGRTIAICHATSSDANPYRLEAVDVASTGELRGGHGSTHIGPVWDPTLKARHIAWGDIIPAYTSGDVSYPGQNLTPAGVAILAADCAIAAPDAALESPSGPVEGHETPATEPTDGLPAASLPSDAIPTDAPPTTEPTGDTPTDETPSDETPTDETPTGSTPSDAPPTDGEVVIDGPFITPTPDPTPVGDVKGATGVPEMTPPSTDTVSASGTAPGSGLQLLLLAVAGLTFLVLIVGRVPAARRS